VPGFQQEQAGDGGNAELIGVAAGCQRQQQGEQHHADTVVEQAFACDGGLQRPRNADAFQDIEHRDRIGGRYQGAEHKAPRDRDTQAAQRCNAQHGHANQSGR
jgi:hypothetical protein